MWWDTFTGASWNLLRLETPSINVKCTSHARPCERAVTMETLGLLKQTHELQLHSFRKLINTFWPGTPFAIIFPSRWCSSECHLVSDLGEHYLEEPQNPRCVFITVIPFLSSTQSKMWISRFSAPLVFRSDRSEPAASVCILFVQCDSRGAIQVLAKQEDGVRSRENQITVCRSYVSFMTPFSWTQNI